MRTRLNKAFFARDTLKVAEELLGKVLVRAEEEELIAERNADNNAEEFGIAPQRTPTRCTLGRIVETEAYIGQEDKACHARHGKTKRNAVMWGPAGYTYVYLCMGLHNLLNIVTEKEGYPAAVLIRRIEPIIAESSQPPASNHSIVRAKARTRTKAGSFRYSSSKNKYGPGNLTKYFNIDRSHNGTDITESDTLYIVDDGFKLNPSDIERKTRVGIDYAEEYKDKPWRFALKSLKLDN